MLFTHFGISGPIVLSSSAYVKINDKIIIDLKPALSEEALNKRILSDFSKYQNKNFSNSLDDLLPKKLIPVIISLSGIPQDIKINGITKEQRIDLIKLLKNFTLTVKALRPIAEAIITSGGVNFAEVNPKTMESLIIKNLYFIGEVLDVDAYTGGFNLQIAFSTGYLAGKNVGTEVT
jgi:predicted Rossmann fold flavoprotein